MTNRLGGTGLRPFYSLIDGGKEGWLYQEMQDLFVYAQILEQGKTSMKERRIDDEVTVEQLPNLMRAVGFYPSNFEVTYNISIIRRALICENFFGMLCRWKIC